MFVNYVTLPHLRANEHTLGRERLEEQMAG